MDLNGPKISVGVFVIKKNVQEIKFGIKVNVNAYAKKKSVN